MLNIETARTIIESKEPFDVSFWTKDGEIIHARNVVCTSTNFQKNSVNLKFIDSGEIRKIKALLIFNINGEEIFL